MAIGAATLDGYICKPYTGDHSLNDKNKYTNNVNSPLINFS